MILGGFAMFLYRITLPTRGRICHAAYPTTTKHAKEHMICHCCQVDRDDLSQAGRASLVCVIKRVIPRPHEAVVSIACSMYILLTTET